MNEMSKRISDHDIERLLAGQTPEGRPELADVAATIAEFRAVAHEAVPQPSAALLARLDLPVSVGAASVAVSAAGATAPLPQSVTSTAAPADAERSDSRGINKMFEWIAGLGLAAKITAGTGALALSLAGVGAAGALPGPLQEAFDSAVTTTVEEETTEEEVVVEDEIVEDDAEGAVEETLPTGSDEFSGWVKEGAQAEGKVGAEFGAAVSEQAQELREEKAAARGEAGGDAEVEIGDDEAEGEVDAEVEVEVEVGPPSELGKP